MSPPDHEKVTGTPRSYPRACATATLPSQPPPRALASSDRGHGSSHRPPPRPWPASAMSVISNAGATPIPSASTRIAHTQLGHRPSLPHPPAQLICGTSRPRSSAGGQRVGDQVRGMRAGIEHRPPGWPCRCHMPCAWMSVRAALLPFPPSCAQATAATPGLACAGTSLNQGWAARCGHGDVPGSRCRRPRVAFACFKLRRFRSGEMIERAERMTFVHVCPVQRFTAQGPFPSGQSRSGACDSVHFCVTVNLMCSCHCVEKTNSGA